MPSAPTQQAKYNLYFFADNVIIYFLLPTQVIFEKFYIRRLVREE